MTTKDLCYLATIVVVMLLAYCHGFFSGFARARKLYESLLGKPEAINAPPLLGAPESSHPPMAQGGVVLSPLARRNRLSGLDLQGDFGSN